MQRDKVERRVSLLQPSGFLGEDHCDGDSYQSQFAIRMTKKFSTTLTLTFN